MYRRLKKQALRVLIPVHRYLGLVLSLVMLLWFLSGIVMMFQGYPRTTETDRLAWLADLSPSELRVGPGEAVSTLGMSEPASARFNQPADRPLLHLLGESDGWQSVYADTGRLVAPLDRSDAARRARQLSGHPIASVEHLKHPDQWTVSDSFDAYRPLWRVALNDSDGTVLYLSRATGEAIHATTRSERLWGYAGAVVHWIYPTRLRELSGVWRQLVMWLAGLGTLSCLTGLVLGVMVLKRRRRQGLSPYRGWMRWHHYLGLVFGVVATTWVFSGLLSLDPFNGFAGNRIPASLERTLGGTATLATPWPAPVSRTGEGKLGPSPREIRPWRFHDQTYYRVVSSDRTSRLLPMQSASGLLPGVSLAQVERAVAAVEGLTLPSVRRQGEYDNYYYPGRAHRVRGERPPLPVYRADYAEGVRLYISPDTGEVLRQSTPRGRLKRWLYHGLHNLDFPVLHPGSVGWYALVITFMLGGAAFSLTGLWFTLRYLRRKSNG